VSSLARNVSLAVAAGAVGALANSFAAWACGAFGISRALGVEIAPAFTPAWLYPRLVWGGLWGLLFLLPLSAPRGVWLALLLSLAPSAYQLLVVFPRRGSGLLGLELGALTPVLVLGVNAVWGLATAAWLRVVRGSG
jgi:hypothetical protein